MKNIFLLTVMLLAACSTAKPKQPVSTAPAALPQEQPTPVAESAPVDGGLSQLEKMTFACPKAALNTAAREAKKAPSQGSYQFSFFRIVNDSHHAQYEVHFKSNVHDEPELKYCVSVYCQQGWDPSKTSVTLIGDSPEPTGAGSAGTTHQAACRDKAPAKHRPKR